MLGFNSCEQSTHAISPLLHFCSGTPGSESSGSEKIKSESACGSTKSSRSSLHSPKEAVQTPQDSSELPEESKAGLTSLPGSPGEESLEEGPNFTKLSVYSPSSIPEQFSVPENIGTEAQISTSLPTAVSDVQGAKSYYSDSEYSVSSNSEVTGSYYSPSTTRGYSFSQTSISPTPLMSPYPASYNSPAAEGMMTPGGTMYPSACMSPTYMSPYGTGKQYTWPAPTNGVNYGAFGMNSHELMQSGYGYQPSAAAAYSQMAMTRSNYPAGYFPPQMSLTSTTQSC